jgi:glucose-1-phosphate thymidylyltransferase
MKVIIPLGGFGLRLYPLTKDYPKAFLKIHGKTLLDYTIDKINEIEEVSEIILVTNNKFYNQFLEWKDTRKENIKIINNGINTDQELSSGLGNLLIAINNEEIDDDILVIGGDNFFECSLREIYEIFKKEQKDIAILYDIKDIEKAKSLGVAKLLDNLIENFEEKPQNPKSTICSTSAYFYRKDTLNLIREMKKTSPHGNIGSVIEFLYKNVPVYGYVVKEKWVDINDKSALKNVDPETYKDL